MSKKKIILTIILLFSIIRYIRADYFYFPGIENSSISRVVNVSEDGSASVTKTISLTYKNFNLDNLFFYHDLSSQPFSYFDCNVFSYYYPPNSNGQYVYNFHEFQIIFSRISPEQYLNNSTFTIYKLKNVSNQAINLNYSSLNTFHLTCSETILNYMQQTSNLTWRINEDLGNETEAEYSSTIYLPSSFKITETSQGQKLACTSSEKCFDKLFLKSDDSSKLNSQLYLTIEKRDATLANNLEIVNNIVNDVKPTWIDHIITLGEGILGGLIGALILKFFERKKTTY